MPSKGYESYFVVGEQKVLWTTPAAAMLTPAYEPRSFSLMGTGDNYIPSRFMRNASPVRPAKGRIGCQGSIALDLVTEGMLVFWKYLLNDDAVGSTDFTAQNVFHNVGARKAFAAAGSPYSLDTQPGATVPSSAPGRLSFDLAAGDTGTVVITGTNYGDQVITETVTFTAEAAKTTTQYFKTVNANGLVVAGLTQDALINCDRNIYTHIIQVKDALLKGLTIEAVHGGLPSVYTGVMVSSGVLDIGNIVGLTLDCMGEREWNRYKFLASNDPTVSDTPTAIGGFVAMNDLTYSDWSLEIDFDASGSAIPVANASFSFSNSLTFRDMLSGTRPQLQPVRSGPREITLAVSVDYEAAALQYVQKHLNLDDIIASLVIKSSESDGCLKTTTINMGRCVMNTYPAVEASDFSQVLQPLVMRPIRSIGAVSADELTVTVESIEAAIA